MSIFQQKEDPYTIVENNENINDSDNQFIKDYIAENYSTFVKEYNCWMLPESKDSYIKYCMEIKRINDVLIKSIEHKFVEINGLYVNEKNIIDPDNAPHVAAGKSGFYVFKKENGKWSVVSKIIEFNSETWGVSGVNKDSFTQFGPESYGWKISDGGMWQGQIYKNIIFIALVDHQLKKILNFPMTYNADGYGVEEFIKNNFQNKLIIDKTEIQNDLYKLQLASTKDGKTKSFTISFNREKGEYEYPQGLPVTDF